MFAAESDDDLTAELARPIGRVCPACRIETPPALATCEECGG
jgi:hypothetical protein